MSLINREELLADIMDDGGLQYPRWWYVNKVKTSPGATLEADYEALSDDEFLEICGQTPDELWPGKGSKPWE